MATVQTTATILQPPEATISKDAYIPTAKDQEILDTPEHLFHNQTWDDLKLVISENRLEDLKRRPGDLRRYLEWGAQVRSEYGSVQRYILMKRLHWDKEGDLIAKSTVPFADADDTKILFNDWPYGMTPGIIHIVVWTKVAIPIDETNGDVTPESRKLIEDYVYKTFVKDLGLPEDHVLWFKNWASLQSVRTVEHVHILVNTIGVQDSTNKLKTIAA